MDTPPLNSATQNFLVNLFSGVVVGETQGGIPDDASGSGIRLDDFVETRYECSNDDKSKRNHCNGDQSRQSTRAQTRPVSVGRGNRDCSRRWIQLCQSRGETVGLATLSDTPGWLRICRSTINDCGIPGQKGRCGGVESGRGNTWTTLPEHGVREPGRCNYLADESSTTSPCMIDR